MVTMIITYILKYLCIFVTNFKIYYTYVYIYVIYNLYTKNDKKNHRPMCSVKGVAYNRNFNELTGNL